MKTRGKTLGAALAGLGLVLAVGSTVRAEMVWSGYTQAWFNIMDSDLDKPSEFDLRRARLKYAGTFNSRGTEAAIQVCLGKLEDRQSSSDPRNREVVLKDLWVRHPFTPELSARLGFATIPFGFEEEYSSSRRLPLERSKAAGSFFPGERDTGLYLFYNSPQPNAPQFLLGYTNGMYEWGDRAANGDQDTEAHALVTRLQWKLPRGGVAGLSYMTANRDRQVGGVEQSFDQNCFGVHVRHHTPQGINLQAEYYDGRILDVSADGWYAQIEYTPGPARAMPFYRYDVFEDGVPGRDPYKRHTLGVGFEPDKSQRVTVQWERYDDPKGGTFNNYGFQYQFKYGG